MSPRVSFNVSGQPIYNTIYEFAGLELWLPRSERILMLLHLHHDNYCISWQWYPTITLETYSPSYGFVSAFAPCLRRLSHPHVLSHGDKHPGRIVWDGKLLRYHMGASHDVTLLMLVWDTPRSIFFAVILSAVTTPPTPLSPVDVFQFLDLPKCTG